MNTKATDKVKNFKVSILDEDYFLLSDESEEHIKNAALLVDNYLRQVAEKSPDTNLKHIAVLVALRLASNSIKTQDLVRQCEYRQTKIIDFINNELDLLSTKESQLNV